MTTALLIRHGRSVANTAGTLAGRSPDIATDDIGKSEAMSLGERLRGTPIVGAVVSPLQRCRETLDLALASAGLSAEVHVDERVSEVDFGEWTGRHLTELTQDPLWKKVQQSPTEVTFPGGESFLSARKRMVESYDHWRSHFPERSVWLVCSHADPLKLLLSHHLNQPLDSFQRLVLDPASVSVIHHRPDSTSTQIVVVNSTAGQLRDQVPTRDLNSAPGGGLGSGDGTES